MSFTKEIDSFLQKYSIIKTIEKNKADEICEEASGALGVKIGTMSCAGESWYVSNDEKWWSNYPLVKKALEDLSSNSLFVCFKGYPDNRLVEISLKQLLTMIEDDDFFHNIFAFDNKYENAIFDDHSGSFCGIGYFSDAMQKYC